MSSLLKQALQTQMQAFFSPLDAVLRGDDPDAVHDMRVASRRLQEILQVVLPKTGDRADVLGEIRKARRLQTLARDVDVVIEIIGNGKQEEATSDLDRGVKLLQTHLRSRREEIQADLREGLERLKLRDSKIRLEDLLDECFSDGPDTGKVVKRIASKLARREEEFREASALARKTRLPKDLHNVRIAAKRLRYILEVAKGLQTHDVEEQISRLKVLQETLGKWHDLEVLEDILVDFCSEKRGIRRHTSAFRALYGLVLDAREAKAEYVSAFLEADEVGELR